PSACAVTARVPRTFLLGGLGRGLHLRLEGADLGERLGSGDVGHRPVGALLAVLPGGLAPALRPDSVLLAEQRDEDLGLLLAEAGQGVQPLEKLLAVFGLPPDPLGVPVVLLHQEPAELLYPLRHRT